MKRYPLVIGATVAGLAGVLSFHSHGVHALGRSLAVTPPKGGKSSSSAPASTPRSTTTTAPATSAGPPASSAAPPATTSATGSLEQYGYGELSVQVTVSGSRITDARVVDLRTAETYSQQIAQQVVPYLRRQVLATQSARINGISGASYTSQAYALSVQSALDQLHFQ